MVNINKLKPGVKIKVKSFEEIKEIDNNFKGMIYDEVVDYLKWCANKILTIKVVESGKIYVKENMFSYLLVREIEKIIKHCNIEIPNKFFKL